MRFSKLEVFEDVFPGLILSELKPTEKVSVHDPDWYFDESIFKAIGFHLFHGFTTVGSVIDHPFGFEKVKERWGYPQVMAAHSMNRSD
jgi:hypothetical protein